MAARISLTRMERHGFTAISPGAGILALAALLTAATWGTMPPQLIGAAIVWARCNLIAICIIVMRASLLTHCMKLRMCLLVSHVLQSLVQSSWFFHQNVDFLRCLIAFGYRVDAALAWKFSSVMHKAQV